jgi:hypothetical protein
LGDDPEHFRLMRQGAVPSLKSGFEKTRDCLREIILRDFDTEVLGVQACLLKSRQLHGGGKGVGNRGSDDAVTNPSGLGRGEGFWGENFDGHPPIEPSEGFPAQQKRSSPKLPEWRVSLSMSS